MIDFVINENAIASVYRCVVFRGVDQDMSTPIFPLELRWARIDIADVTREVNMRSIGTTAGRCSVVTATIVGTNSDVGRLN